MNWLLGTPSFVLYRLSVSAQLTNGRVRNDDTTKAKETYVFGQELFWKKEVAGREYIKGEALYRNVDLNACQTIGPYIDAAMGEADYPLGTDLKNKPPGKSLHGVIRHRDKTAIYVLNENPEFPWWLTLYVIDGKQPDVCAYNTKEYTDRYPRQ
jgi:hypothetical protein